MEAVVVRLAVGAGAVVLASCGGASLASPIESETEVRPEPLLELASTDTSIVVRDTARLHATVWNMTTLYTINWTSGDASILSVDSTGLVRARDVGQAYVFAAVASARDSTLVRALPNRVVVVPATAERGRPALAQYHAAVIGGGPVRWHIADTSIAVIYSDGMVSTRGVGRTTIAATLLEDPLHTGYAEISVTSLSTLELRIYIEAVTRNGTRDVLRMDGLSGVVDIHTVFKVPPREYFEALLLLDGAVVARRDHSGGLAWYPLVLNTAQLSNGGHELELQLRGEIGQLLSSTGPLQVTISN